MPQPCGPNWLTPAQATAPPHREADDLLAHGLHHSARWLHVQLALSTGVAVLHLQALYGIVNHPAANADLVERVLEYTGRLRNAPHFLGGDLNML